MKKLILNLLGGVSIEKYNRLSNLFKNTRNELNKNRNLKVKPTMKYEQWCSINNSKNWNTYWDACYIDNYNAHHLRELSSYPKLSTEFINQFSKFDWVGTQTYMQSVNWYWHNDKSAPSIKYMQYVVLELIASCIKYCTQTRKSEIDCATGGFEVTVNVENSTITIEFNKNSNTF